MQEIDACPICGSTPLHEFIRTRDYHFTQEEFSLKQCGQCSLIMTSPRPDNDHLSHYYDSPEYLSHAAKPTNLLGHAYRFVRHFTVRNKVALLRRFQEPGTLLDFGCGTAEFLMHARNSGWITYGVEPSETARKVATAQLPDIFPVLDPVPLQSCNAITLWHVLEHVPDLRQTLHNLIARLTPNGTLFIAVPNIASADSRHYRDMWAGLDVPRHLWHFTRKSMERLLQEHNLALTRTIPMKLDAYYVSLLSEKYRNNHKLTIANYVRAMRSATASNRAAQKTGEYSSLLYVARK
jgi:2-polyprenyl-3-methyl-5-hydroxy-6-metoxy-1,4-benzoquinol methylase